MSKPIRYAGVNLPKGETNMTKPVVDEVASQFSWPWTGWATPLWLFLLELALVIGVVVVIVRHRRKRREGDLPAGSPAA